MFEKDLVKLYISLLNLGFKPTLYGCFPKVQMLYYRLLF